MRLRYILAALVLVSALVSQPARSDTGFSCVLSGANEVPPNASPATGSGTFVLNSAQTSLNYSVSYTGLSALRTASHFHGPAAPGVNAPVVFGIALAGPTSDTIIGTWAIPAAQVINLINGLLYINVHSQLFTAGEIRGQIYSDPVKARSTTWGRIKKLYR